MTEPGDPASAFSLDEVRARIFYLACDVESASPSAALLLRAVAEAVGENGMLPEDLSGPASLNGASLHALSQAPALRTLGSRARDEAPASERRLGVVGSQAGYKR